MYKAFSGMVSFLAILDLVFPDFGAACGQRNFTALDAKTKLFRQDSNTRSVVDFGVNAGDEIACMVSSLVRDRCPQLALPSRRDKMAGDDSHIRPKRRSTCASLRSRRFLPF